MYRFNLNPLINVKIKITLSFGTVVSYSWIARELQQGLLCLELYIEVQLARLIKFFVGNRLSRTSQ